MERVLGYQQLPVNTREGQPLQCMEVYAGWNHSLSQTSQPCSWPSTVVEQQVVVMLLPQSLPAFVQVTSHLCHVEPWVMGQPLTPCVFNFDSPAL
jgi:hypothetical protein